MKQNVNEMNRCKFTTKLVMCVSSLTHVLHVFNGRLQAVKNGRRSTVDV